MIDDDLLHDLGELPRSTPPIRPLGQIRLRAEALRRSRRRRSLAGGTASLAGIGVVTLVVAGLPGSLLGSPAPAGPAPGGSTGGATVPACPPDPTAAGAPSVVGTEESAVPATSPTGVPPTVTATPVPPDPGVPWRTAPRLLHLIGKTRPVQARMDDVPPVSCRYAPATGYAGADRGPGGSVRAAIAVDGPWPRRPDLPELQHPVKVRGVTGTLGSWSAPVLDTRGVLAVAWQEPGTRQWWLVRSSGLSERELLAAVTGLRTADPVASLPKRFTALPLLRPSTRPFHWWSVTYRRGADRYLDLSVTDGRVDDGPFARLADIQADRVRLLDVAGGTAFYLPHDNGDTPSVYLVRDGLTIQVTGDSWPGSVQDLRALEQVRADDPRLDGVPRQLS